MKRMPFQRPTEYYDRRLLERDEQLCSLLQERRLKSEGNPGFPPSEQIKDWAEKYGFYEDYLNSFFSFLLNGDKDYRPVIEPRGYRRCLLAGKSVEHEDAIFSVTAIRQYANASVVSLHIDWASEEAWADESPLRRHVHYDLLLESPYEAWFDGGSGSGRQQSCSYVVTPSLPDDLEGVKLVFRPSDRFRQEGSDKPDIRLVLG